MKTCNLVHFSVICFILFGCISKEQSEPDNQIPVFDVAMQGVNPAWFERAMEGIDFGIHRVEKYGELVADSAELFRKSFEQMEMHNVRYGLLSHGTYKKAFMDARPDLKIVMMHMGWPFFDEALYILGTYPNVFMETSVAIWLLGDQLFNRLLREAVATAGSDKILFGTLQMAWPEVIGRSVTMIREAEYLSIDDKRAILWENAAALFELEE